MSIQQIHVICSCRGALSRWWTRKMPYKCKYIDNDHLSNILGQGISAALQYFIIMVFATCFALSKKVQLLWFWYCPWRYCDFDNILINCAALIITLYVFHTDLSCYDDLIWWSTCQYSVVGSCYFNAFNNTSLFSQVRLIDAGFLWTEPHSKRIKMKVTIQKEVREQREVISVGEWHSN